MANKEGGVLVWQQSDEERLFERARAGPLDGVRARRPRPMLCGLPFAPPPRASEKSFFVTASLHRRAQKAHTVMVRKRMPWYIHAQNTKRRLRRPKQSSRRPQKGRSPEAIAASGEDCAQGVGKSRLQVQREVEEGGMR